jgi:alanyl-tRNA synthetase
MIKGEEIFKLMDTSGLPLDIINLQLRDNDMHFEVEGFIKAAIKAGWKRKTIFDNLFYNSDQSDELKDKINNVLDILC